jgi:small subunit ribosomal protein S16
MGASKRPYYRVVVTDKRNPRDGRFIENIGKYHPLEDPSLIDIDEERAMYWLRTGAQPSDTVRTLLTHVGVWERFVAERPGATRASDALARTNQMKYDKLHAREVEAAKRAPKPDQTPAPDGPRAPSASEPAEPEAAAGSEPAEAKAEPQAEPAEAAPQAEESTEA